MTDIDSTCSFDGCGRPLAALRLCIGHYKQQHAGRELRPLREWSRSALNALDWPERRDDGRCAVDDCQLSAHARGLCRSHYSQVRYGRAAGKVRQQNPVINGMKRCGMCGETQPVANFGKKLTGCSWQCLQCRRVDSRMRAYGLTRDEVLALCEVSQCEACGGDIDSATRNHHIDHCHTTGVVRGVLCHGCNTALGLTGDNAETLRRLADYIESRSAVTA